LTIRLGVPDAANPARLPAGGEVGHAAAGRAAWLRAAVLGANDGIVSTASLVLGVAAAGAPHATVLLTAASGLVAGAMSMAAGEFVSVHTQKDAELADLAREAVELQSAPHAELRELADIYVARGLGRALAERVAVELTAHGALAAHARDEFGLTAASEAQPLRAALASACSFAVGAALPLAVVAIALPAHVLPGVVLSSLAFLGGLGATSAAAGGAPLWPGTWRVTFWGAIAMAFTAGAGALLGRLA